MEMHEVSPGVIVFVHPEGRYPFLATADVPKLIEALRWLASFNAQVMVPGHGLLCGNEQVISQLTYIEDTWTRTAEHIARGHSVEEAVKDPDYPRCAELGFERLHPWNIEAIYRQLKKWSG